MEERIQAIVSVTGGRPPTEEVHLQLALLERLASEGEVGRPFHGHQLCYDSHLSELGLHRLNDSDVHHVSSCGMMKGRLESMWEASLSQKPPCLFRVIFVGSGRGRPVAEDPRRDRGIGYSAGAAHHILDDLLLVHRVVDRLANTDVGEGLALGVEPDVDRTHAVSVDDIDRRIRLQPGDIHR